MSEDKFMFEIKDIIGSGTESQLTLHEIGSWAGWWVGS